MIQNHTNKIIGWNSPRPIHPGEHLVDFLKESGISQTELAKRTGISKKAINEIVNGKNPITQNTAFRFSKVFSVSPEFWSNLQNNYDMSLAKIEETERLQSEIVKYVPDFKETYQELARCGFVQKFSWVQKNMREIAKNLQHFFAVDSLEYVQKGTMEFAFRKYDRTNLNHHTLAAWVQLGKIQAKIIKVEPFDKEKLRAQLPYLKSLSREPWQKYVPELGRLLANCGVVLILAPKMKCALVQGATHWIDTDKVLVMLSAENQYEDRFWFNLFHELGHVLLHGKKDVYVDFGQDGQKTEEEKEADVFAQKWLISDFKEFYEILNQQDLESAINAFAKANDISPAIVAGRLTHEHANQPKIYALMSPYQKERISYSNLTFGEKPEDMFVG